MLIHLLCRKKSSITTNHVKQQRRNQEFYFGGAEAHGERGARGYNGGLGAEPLVGVRGRSPPEAETFFVDVRP